MRSGDYGKLYDAQLEDSLRFADFVGDMLHEHLGLAVTQYASRAYQFAVGESRGGIEIKHDKHCLRSRRLWIEFAEKGEPRPGSFVASGIMRADNTWLWAIGDYNRVYLLGKTLLRKIKVNYPQKINRFGTSLAFYLPFAHADEYALAILTPNDAERKVITRMDAGRIAGLATALQRAILGDPSQLQLFVELEDR